MGDKRKDLFFPITCHPSLITMIEVVNRQRKVLIDCERWRAFVAQALKVAPADGAGVTVAFVSDRLMRELNRRWRGKSGTTDVLSFPSAQDEYEKLEGLSLGDVVISVEQAARQAFEHGLKFDEEVAQLILHGVLHLCGYDHETDTGEMNRLELRLRRRLGI
ncbi:MAG TPA: rRNA maturation RNase YbeY [Pyrinomonadaceae bacterium]|nr:rRNA maturation RNase YbeY [Pyrinomonadaceae bacterium]